MKQDVILVLDCGATNVRAMAVDRQGKIIARAATANASDIAAEIGWYGVGEFSSPEQARAQVAYRYRYFWPQTEPELIEEA